MHSVSSALEAKSGAVCLRFLDYTAALGSVDRPILLNQLSATVIPIRVCGVAKDYFTNRTQFIQINGAKSTAFLSGRDVSQGAIALPALFSLYIGKFPIPSTFIECKYAEDVLLGCVTPTAMASSTFQNGLDHRVL